MLDLDKIRARLDRDAVCHCGELIRHHSQLSGHTAVEMTDPSHEETHALLDEIERLRSEFAAAQPVVEWHRIRDFDRAEMGYLILTVHSDGWTIRAVDIAVDELATLAEGDEGGDAGKAACEAAYRRACGIPTAPPCAA